MTVKEDLGFGQTGERDEKITVAEHDQRMVWKELQRVRYRRAAEIFIQCWRLMIWCCYCFYIWCCSTLWARW